MVQAGVVLNRIGKDRNILKIRPPMQFRPEHADILVQTLTHVLAGHSA